MVGLWHNKNNMSAHNFPIRIYYEDTDAGGIVYYANYLRFAERARTELLRAHNLESAHLREQCGILIVVKHVEIDYKKSARLDDSLILETTIDQIGATSMTMRQIVCRDGVELCAMNVTLVCIAAASARPVRWPDIIVNALRENPPS